MGIPAYLFSAVAALLFPTHLVLAASVIKHVIVIAMENTDATEIHGNKKQAPYINNKIMPSFARKQFQRSVAAQHAE